MTGEEERQLLFELAKPGMTPADAVKWLYQSTFGPAHLLRDPDAARTRLQAERRAVGFCPGVPLWTPLGGGMARLNLAALPEEPAAEALAFRLFSHAAKGKKEPDGAFDIRLARLRALAAAGETPFSAQALEEYLKKYDAEGRPAVHHSESYRAANRPAYRVVEGGLLPFWPLLLAMERNILQKGRVTVAIDGRCAAGKSTLADRLAALFGGSVARMDDFFLPPEGRTPERLGQPGGNVDWERFDRQVARPLSLGQPAAYRSFDCAAGSLRAEEISVSPCPAAVVEGCYSLRPELRYAYDLTVWLTLDGETQRKRLINRNGAGATRFFERWIPLEEAYFSAFSLPLGCDFVFAGPGV